MKLDKVFFINLDHRTDRLAEINGELESHGLANLSERFPAIRHETIGGVGCGRSHIEVLRLAKERGYSRILVLEDDFMFTVGAPEFEKCMQTVDDLNFDVCLLAGHLITISAHDEHDFLYKVHEAQTTSGYIINSHYYDTLIQVFSDAVLQFEATNHHWLYAIDVAWKTLQMRDDWVCLNPRVGKQRPSYSDCGNTFSETEW
jgi:glycosyl transferase family 25